MSRYISNDIKETIENHIKNIEADSSAEIVCVVANASDKYRYIIFLYSALIALIAPLALFLFGLEFGNLKIIEFQILLFLFISFVLEYSDFKYKLIPKRIKQNRCEKLALYQFYKLGINKTSNHKAILILICIKEKYIRIVADSEIDKIVSQNTWDEIVKNFIGFVKKQKLGEGILYTINECGKILTKDFPRDKNSKDELQNDIIEI